MEYRNVGRRGGWLPRQIETTHSGNEAVSVAFGSRAGTAARRRLPSSRMAPDRRAGWAFVRLTPGDGGAASLRTRPARTPRPRRENWHGVRTAASGAPEQTLQT